MPPLVSILVPCYNAAKHIRGAIQCMLAQTYPRIEIIVADDGSTDASPEILAEFGDRIRVARGPNRGACAARNEAFALSRGELVMFHDADDAMVGDKAARQVETALARPGAVIYGPWRLRYSDGASDGDAQLFQTRRVPEDSDLLDMTFRGWFCPVHSYLWPRRAIERLGGWDESLAANQDGDLAMRAMVAGIEFAYSPESWVDYVQHGGLRVSTARTARTLRSRVRVARKIARALDEQGRLDDYRDAIAWYLDDMARDHWENCRPAAAWCARQARRISCRPSEVGVWHYRLVRRYLGVYVAESLAMAKRKLERIF